MLQSMPAEHAKVKLRVVFAAGVPIAIVSVIPREKPTSGMLPSRLALESPHRVHVG